MAKQWLKDIMKKEDTVLCLSTTYEDRMKWLLQCSQCFSFLGDSLQKQVYSCKHGGHLVCQPCKDNRSISICHSCWQTDSSLEHRNPEEYLLRRNASMETVLEYFRELLNKEPHQELRAQCSCKPLISVFQGGHGPDCSFRHVQCAGRQNGCDWAGGFAHLLPHVRTTRCCVFMGNGTSQADGPLNDCFKVRVKDVHDGVLSKKDYFRFQPLFLYNSEVVRIMPYFILDRSPEGVWHYFLCAYANDAVLDKLCFTVKFLSADPNTIAPTCFTWKGKIMHSNAQHLVTIATAAVNSEYFPMGTISDSEVKVLRSDKLKTLFRMEITVHHRNV
jgi:hypothetical protein